jgi:methionyl-tRNA formyltransferase
MHLMARVVFMGSPEFAVPALRALTSQHSIVGVVTQPDRPAGRGRSLRPPAVKAAASELGLPIFQPPTLRTSEAMDQLRGWAPELIVVAAFGQILRPNVLLLPPFGCLNVHASLLPRWRGAAPVQAAIAAGDSQTGVTIMKMDEGLDTGPIIAQRSIPIEADDTGGSLTTKLAQLGAELLLETLPGYLGGRLPLRPQDSNLATRAPLLKKQDGLLEFSETAASLERRVRALLPWPGALVYLQQERIGVLRAHAIDGRAAPSARLVVQGLPALGTAEGILVLDELRPPGRKTMSGSAFLAGARDWLAPT